MIHHPLRVEQNPGAVFACIRDSSDRVIAGGLSREDAEEIVSRLNTHPKPRKKSRAERLADELRASDVTAQSVGRDDVIYGSLYHHCRKVPHLLAGEHP